MSNIFEFGWWEKHVFGHESGRYSRFWHFQKGILHEIARSSDWDYSRGLKPKYLINSIWFYWFSRVWGPIWGQALSIFLWDPLKGEAWRGHGLAEISRTCPQQVLEWRRGHGHRSTREASLDHIFWSTSRPGHFITCQITDLYFLYTSLYFSSISIYFGNIYLFVCFCFKAIFLYTCLFSYGIP